MFLTVFLGIFFIIGGWALYYYRHVYAKEHAAMLKKNIGGISIMRAVSFCTGILVLCGTLCLGYGLFLGKENASNAAMVWLCDPSDNNADNVWTSVLYQQDYHGRAACERTASWVVTKKIDRRWRFVASDGTSHSFVLVGTLKSDMTRLPRLLSQLQGRSQHAFIQDEIVFPLQLLVMEQINDRKPLKSIQSRLLMEIVRMNSFWKEAGLTLALNLHS